MMKTMKTAQEILMKLLNVLCFADFSGETTVFTLLWNERSL